MYKRAKTANKFIQMLEFCKKKNQVTMLHTTYQQFGIQQYVILHLTKLHKTFPISPIVFSVCTAHLIYYT